MPRDQPAGGPAMPHQDARWVEEWLAGTWRAWRLWAAVRAVVIGIALACATGAVLRAAGAPAPTVAAVSVGALTALLVIVTSRGVRSVGPVIEAAEAAAPALRNALVAWHEGRHVLSPPIASRLAAHARRALEPIQAPRPHSTGSWARVLTLLALGVIANLLVGAPDRNTPATVATPAATVDTGTARAELRWAVTVTPPPYAGRRPVRAAQPTQLEVLAGSRVDVAFSGWPSGASVRLGQTPLALEGTPEAPTAHLLAHTSDVLVVRDAAGTVTATVTLVVRPDAPPAVRITAPAADLRRIAATGQVPIRIVARDQLGLRDLRLRFTKVSGSGESFTFEDGEWPLSIARASATEWTGSRSLDLATLGIGPGDSVVYHAVAHDARRGPDGAAESERFLIEIARPGALAAGDFSLPEPEEKFALSQRMVIQLTERLLERQPRIPPDVFRQEAQALAIAQRRVRAAFVFMLGGDVEDEVEEAAHAHEIAAGRLDNRGQGDLTEAVRQMSQAEARLTAAALREALSYEYKALAALQAALGKARYFMRTLPAPVQIDGGRRLQGDRADAASARWARTPLPEAARSAGLGLLQRIEGTRGPAAPWLPELVGLDRADAAWVALVQRTADADGLAGLAGLLRARLLAGSTAWMAMPLARRPAELVASPGGARP